MKKVVLLFLLSAAQQLCLGQRLSIGDLDFIYHNDIEHCDSLLNSRGFVFDKANENEDKKMVTQWHFKRSKTNTSSPTNSNEYISKTCSNITFSTECDLIQYIISDYEHFISLKEYVKTQNIVKYMYTDNNPNSGLNFYYLYPGPIELRFTSLPPALTNNINVYVVTLKRMIVEEQ